MQTRTRELGDIQFPREVQVVVVDIEHDRVGLEDVFWIRDRAKIHSCVSSLQCWESESKRNFVNVVNAVSCEDQCDEKEEQDDVPVPKADKKT